VDVKAGKAKDCFGNAYRLALHEPERFIYVEGYFAAKVLSNPIEHAWCIDSRTLRVVDSTLIWVGEYWGVPFRIDYLNQIVMEGGGFGVIDNLTMGSPLLTGVHSIEKAIDFRGYPPKRKAKAVR
jgi:hypothetical protein